MFGQGLIDIAAFVRFADLFQVPPARFTRQAVAHLLEVEQPEEQVTVA